MYWVKKAFFLSLVVIALFFTSLYLLTRLIEPIHLQEELAKHLLAKTNRQLSIDGEVSWHVFPSLTVHTHQLTLSNPEPLTQQAMATVDKMKCSVNLWSLLTGTLQVDAIEIEGLHLFLEVDIHGQNNWHDLFDKEGAEQLHTQSFSASPTLGLLKRKDFRLSFLRFRDVDVHYMNRITGKQLELKNFHLLAQNIINKKPFDLTLETTILSPHFSSALTIHSPTTVIDLEQESIVLPLTDITGVLDFTSPKRSTPVSLNTQLYFSAKSREFKMLKLQGSFLNGMIHGDLKISDRKTLKMQGLFEAENIRLNQWSIQKLRIPIKTHLKQIFFQPIEINAYQGEASGQVRWDPEKDPHILWVEMNGSGWSLGDLLKDLTGFPWINALGNWEWSTQINHTERCAQLPCFDGTLKLHTQAGSLSGLALDTWQLWLNQPDKKQDKELSPYEQHTPVGYCATDLEFKKERWLFKNVICDGQFFNLRGQGELLLKNTLAHSLLSTKLNIQYQNNPTALPILLKGPLDHLKITPDWEAWLLQSLKKDLKKGNILHEFVDLLSESHGHR